MLVCLLNNGSPLPRIRKAGQHGFEIGKIAIERKVVPIRLQYVIEAPKKHDLARFCPNCLEVARADALSVDRRARFILEEARVNLGVRLQLIEKSLIADSKRADHPFCSSPHPRRKCMSKHP